MLPLELTFLDTYFLVMVFVFGSVVGSFLNVVIYRFHTGKSLNGNSHCLSCQQNLSWYELFPIFSYLVLRGKCRVCGSYIPIRYALVEFLTALGFLAIFLKGGPVILLTLTALLFSLLVVVFVYDLYHFVIPDDLVIYISVVVALTFGLFLYEGLAASKLLLSIAAGVSAASFFGFLWKVSSGKWIGFGDVKLALPLGILAGFPGSFSMVVLAFWVGAVVSLCIIFVQQILKRGQFGLRIFGSPLKMKSEVPFAPFLIAGFILSYFYGVDVLSLVTYVL